jgi:hypothetical protein
MSGICEEFNLKFIQAQIITEDEAHINQCVYFGDVLPDTKPVFLNVN